MQGAALVHFFRRRPNGVWLWVIFFGGFIDAAVYIVVEMLPDVDLLRHTYRGYGRRSRIAVVQTAILELRGNLLAARNVTTELELGAIEPH